MRIHTALPAILGFLSILPLQARDTAVAGNHTETIAGITATPASDYYHVTTAEIVLASLFAVSTGCCAWLYTRKKSPVAVSDAGSHDATLEAYAPPATYDPSAPTAPDSPGAEPHTEDRVTTENEDRAGDENRAGMEMLQTIIEFGLTYSENMEKLSDNLRAIAKESRRNDIHTRDNIRLLNRQSENFQRLFDTAFLNTYPCFVERLNSLLLPEKTFQSPIDGQLTPELRVAAFMRIGVDDCNRIARMLRLSLNTVYTYRNRTRQRAADRDSFMADLMKIS